MLQEGCSIQSECSINSNSMALYGALSQTSKISGFSNQRIKVVVDPLAITLSGLFGEFVLHVSMNLASVGPDSLCLL